MRQRTLARFLLRAIVRGGENAVIHGIVIILCQVDGLLLTSGELDESDDIGGGQGYAGEATDL